MGPGPRRCALPLVPDRLGLAPAPGRTAVDHQPVERLSPNLALSPAPHKRIAHPRPGPARPLGTPASARRADARLFTLDSQRPGRGSRWFRGEHGAELGRGVVDAAAHICDDARIDTTIRNLDERAYRELKARAALSGRTLGEVVNETIRSWELHSDPHALAQMASRGASESEVMAGWLPNSNVSQSDESDPHGSSLPSREM